MKYRLKLFTFFLCLNGVFACISRPNQDTSENVTVNLEEQVLFEEGTGGYLHRDDFLTHDMEPGRRS